MRSLPSPRGPVTELLIGTLQDPPGTLEALEPPRFEAPQLDEDLQLALYLCYELHYRGLPGVDDDWEWDPSLLSQRRELELEFERALLEAVLPVREPVPALNHLDRRWAAHVLERWAHGRTSLLGGLGAYEPDAGVDPVLASG